MQTGQGMAHVKLRSTADIDPALFTSRLRQLRELEVPAYSQEF
jgi:hypothetical protein